MGTTINSRRPTIEHTRTGLPILPAVWGRERWAIGAGFFILVLVFAPISVAIAQEVRNPCVASIPIAKAEIAKAEIAKAEVAKAEIAKAEIAKAEIAKAEVAKAEIAKTEIAKAEIAKAEIAKCS